jgi:peroxiredoxin
MTDPTSLPPNLPEPQADGASDHLVGLRLSQLALPTVSGGSVALNDFPTGWLVLYVYPRTGGPDIDLPDGWDMIPGARGCTPQACAFRDHHDELQALDATVWGLSAQPIEEQTAFAARMHIPFPLLNDSALALSTSDLALPTLDAGGMTLYRRLTLIASASGIAKVFYPVFPPDQNAADVIHYLKGLRAGSA